MIKEVSIDSMNDLLEQINALPNNFVYRGHANSNWQLESTLERVLGEKWSRDNAAKFEKFAVDKFKSKYHLYRSGEHEPSSKLAWLSVMQHYGVPTRLIDFTESPYVALYFALEAYNPLSKDDLAVYALDYTAIMDVTLDRVSKQDNSFNRNRLDVSCDTDRVFDDIVDRFCYSVLWVTEPLELNVRIDKQTGTFVLSGNTECSVEELLSLEEYSSCQAYKYVIGGAFYENLFALLRKMNISAKTIYGDLGGLAKSIRMELQAYAI